MCGVCGARARTLGADAGTIIEFELAACKTLASKASGQKRPDYQWTGEECQAGDADVPAECA